MPLDERSESGDTHFVNDSNRQEAIVSPVVERSSSKKMYEPVTKKTRAMKKRVFNIMESAQCQAVLITCLFISLFFPDAWVMANPPDSANDGKDTIVVIVMAIFIFETATYSYCQDGYLFGFYFWMDIVGTLSMILDINWIIDKFSGQGSETQSGSYLRAVRAAKLGARYGRLMRFFKFLKYLRYLPCFKEGEETEPTMSAVRKVSTELGQSLIRSVAFLTLTLVIILPFIAVPVNDNSIDSFMNVLHSIASSDGSATGVDDPTANFEHTADQFVGFVSHLNPVMRLVVKSTHLYGGVLTTVHADDAMPHIRAANIISYDRAIVDGVLTASLNFEEQNYWDAFCGTWLMILVVLIFVVYSAGFQSTIDSKVNAPLDKSTQALRNCAGTMLKSMKALELEKMKELESPVVEEDDDDASDLDRDLETEMLEKLVEKLARIIQHMVPGTTDLVVDQNVDSATASWLNQSYASKAATKKMDDSQQMEMHTMKKRETSIVSTEILNSWDFDVLNYDHEQLFEIVHVLFDVFDVFGRFDVPPTTFALFTKEIATRYIENSYHNFKHGCDVLHAVYNLMIMSNLHNACSTLEVFSLLTAALAHDVGHLGLNNVYLVKAKHKLALRHNDKSPLENMHCAVLYEVLGKTEANIFATLTESQWRESRKIILTCILGTDMSHHFEQISKVQLFLEVNGSQVQPFSAKITEEVPAILLESEQRLFMMEVMLHCADISNPYKPFELCAKWADLVVFEFCAQGDREKKEGLEVSPMMDRDTINLYNMQMGFIEFVVAPLILGVVNVLPSLHVIGENMLNNMIAWGQKRKDEIASSEMPDQPGECRKVDERLSKFSEKMAFLPKMREMTRDTNPGQLNRRLSSISMK